MVEVFEGVMVVDTYAILVKLMAEPEWQHAERSRLLASISLLVNFDMEREEDCKALC